MVNVGTWHIFPGQPPIEFARSMPVTWARKKPWKGSKRFGEGTGLEYIYIYIQYFILYIYIYLLTSKKVGLSFWKCSIYIQVL